MCAFISRLLHKPFPLAIMTLAFFFALSAGCSNLPKLPGQSTAIPPVATDTPIALVETATLSAPTDEPTLAPTEAATQAPTLPAPTANPPLISTITLPTPIPSGNGFDRVKIFLIAVGDDGKSGAKIGCGDSVIAVDRMIPPTRGPLAAALNQLLSLHDQYYGQSGLYNALYQSNLSLQSVAIIRGTAVIKMTGKMMLGGVCDDPRVDAQISNTALQFSTVHAVDAYINGTPLKTLLSEKGQ